MGGGGVEQDGNSLVRDCSFSIMTPIDLAFLYSGLGCCMETVICLLSYVAVAISLHRRQVRLARWLVSAALTQTLTLISLAYEFTQHLFRVRFSRMVAQTEFCFHLAVGVLALITMVLGFLYVLHNRLRETA